MSLKDAKLNFVIEVATSLFMQKSIAEVTIKEIADTAGIGEATIYRYFKRKESVVLACVMKLQEKVSAKYFMLKDGKTGYEKLEIFYNSYLQVYKENPGYFYFLKEFDAYITNQNPKKLESYEKNIDNFKKEYIEAYELGLKDKSVKEVKNIEVFYFSTTHAMIELCKKLSLKKALLAQDKNIKKTSEILCLIRVILNSLKGDNVA